MKAIIITLTLISALVFSQSLLIHKANGETDSLKLTDIDSMTYLLDESDTILADDFDDNNLDVNTWILPYGTVVEENQRIEMTSKSYIATKQQYTGSASNPLVIEFQLTNNTGDNFSVFTRSDPINLNGSNDITNGIRFQIGSQTANTLRIQKVVDGTYTSLVNVTGVPTGTPYNVAIKIYDDGDSLKFYIDDVLKLATADNTTFTQNNISFRLLTGSSYVDDFVLRNRE